MKKGISWQLTIPSQAQTAGQRRANYEIEDRKMATAIMQNSSSSTTKPPHECY